MIKARTQPNAIRPAINSGKRGKSAENIYHPRLFIAIANSRSCLIIAVWFMPFNYHLLARVRAPMRTEKSSFPLKLMLENVIPGLFDSISFINAGEACSWITGPGRTHFRPRFRRINFRQDPIHMVKTAKVVIFLVQPRLRCAGTPVFKFPN